MARVIGYNEHATSVNQTIDGRKKLTVATRMEVSEGRAFIAGVVDGLRYVSVLSSDDRYTDLLSQKDRSVQGALTQRARSRRKGKWHWRRWR